MHIRRAVTTTCLSALVITPAPSAFAAVDSSKPTGQTTSASQRLKAPTAENGFNTCAAKPSLPKGRASNLGKQYGPGITEIFTPAQVKKINASQRSAERSALPTGTSVIRYLDSGEFIELNAKGQQIGTLSLPQEVFTYSFHDEIKKIVGSCLGVGVVGIT